MWKLKQKQKQVKLTETENREVVVWGWQVREIGRS